MDFNDPSSYISIISSVLLIISEVLPFLPCKPNGLIDVLFIDNKGIVFDKILLSAVLNG